VQFAASSFVPVVLGLFGLGTGYLVWGPQELTGYPPRDRAVDRSMGVWGLFMPGLCQLVTGVLLFVGMTWFQVFQEKPLYMAALAFSAYGIHWFALGWNRLQGNDPRPNLGMSVAFIILSVLGLIVFFKAADGWPVGLLFCGLTAVYVSELFVSMRLAIGERLLGLSHIVTGLWLMYLTFATVLDITSGYTWPHA
jgi:hypothetical protein